MMARRKTYRRPRTRTRTVTRYVRSRGSRSALTGAMKPIIGGMATGAIQSFIPDNALGGYGDSLAPIGVGYFMKDKTLMTIGGYQLGLKLAGSMMGGKTATNSGFFE